MYQF